MLRRIEVQPYFAEFAKKQNKAACAIAMAMKIRGFSHPFVDTDYIAGSVPETGERYWWATPKKAADMIRYYDQTGKVYPVNFSLNTEKAVRVRERQLGPAPKVLRETKKGRTLDSNRRKGKNARGTVPQSLVE